MPPQSPWITKSLSTIVWMFVLLGTFSQAFTQEAVTQPRSLDQLTQEANLVVHGVVGLAPKNQTTG